MEVLMDLDKAVEVFTSTSEDESPNGKECVPFGPLKVIRDWPGRKGPPRTIRFVSHGVDAATTATAIREYRPGKYLLCVVHGPGQDPTQVKKEFKGEGFKLMVAMPFFACDLSGFKPAPNLAPVSRVTTSAEAEAVATAARRKQIRDEDIGREDASTALFAAWEGDRVVGWVSSRRVRGVYAWVYNLYVLEPNRRQGFGSALMSAMLEDDRAHGVHHSVLLSSATGATLYPGLGYRQIGFMHLFSPGSVR